MSTSASASAPAPTPDAPPAAPAAASGPPPPPLPASALSLLDELGLGKYKKRFSREDVTETAMLLSTLRLPQGPQDLRVILTELGMSVGHREKLILAVSAHL